MADRHEKRELEVFRLFASACDLPIEPTSVTKRNPPEPDILCEIVGEGPVAFEMVELVDQKKIARPIGDQLELMDCLRDGYRNLPAAAKGEFDKRFGNALVRARMRPDISLRKRRLIAGGILDELVKLDAGFEGSFEISEKGKKVASVEVVRGGFAGPHFRIPAAGSYSPVPLEGVGAKFEKNYSTRAPIELLAYYDTQHAPPEDDLRKLSTFMTERMGRTSFRRVWVFSVNDERILFSVSR